MKRAGRDRDKASFDCVAAVRRYQPARFVGQPAQFRDFGLEKRAFVKAEVTRDPFAVLENLRSLGVLLDWNVSNLLKEGQIDIALDVAGSSGIAVPIPGPTEVSGLLYNANVGNPVPQEAASDHQATEAAAD